MRQIIQAKPEFLNHCAIFMNASMVPLKLYFSVGEVTVSGVPPLNVENFSPQVRLKPDEHC